jgi:hypothetical protein
MHAICPLTWEFLAGVAAFLACIIVPASVYRP